MQDGQVHSSSRCAERNADPDFLPSLANYGPYRVHRDATFLVRDAAGETDRLRVIGSMIETDGAWKLFSYIVDE